MATNQSKEDNRLQNDNFFHLNQRQKQPMSNLSLNNPPASANSRFDSQNLNKIFTLNRRSWTIRRSAGNRLAHWMRLLTLFSPFFSQRLNVQLSNQRLAYPPVSWSRRECPLEVKSRHFSGFFRGHQRLHIKVIFHWAMHLQATRQVASSGQFISDSGAIYSCGWSNHRWLNQVAGYFFLAATSRE